VVEPASPPPPPRAEVPGPVGFPIFGLLAEFRKDRLGSLVRTDAPRYAYFPFGGGPHLCIGAGFAMTGATIVLASVTQALHLDLEPARSVTVEPLVTLRPNPGVWVTARQRGAS
jgi:cytochrome P450